MRLPAFLRPGREASGLDNATGGILRLTGVALLAIVAFGALMLGMGIFTLATLEAKGDQTGWDGLIAGIALGVGGLMVVGGSAAAYGCHVAFAGWREQRAKPVRWTGAAFAIVGATAPFPAVFQDHLTPLDEYLVIARVVLLGVGLVLLAWTRGRAH